MMFRDKDDPTRPTGWREGAIGTAGVKIAGMLLAFTTSVVLANALGPKAYGDFALVVSLALLLGAPLALGLDILLVRELAAAVAADDRSRVHVLRRAVDRSVAGVSFATSLAASVLLLLGPWPLTSHLGVLLWGVALLLPVCALLRTQQACIQGLGGVAAGQMPQLVVLPLAVLLLTTLFLTIEPLTAPAAVLIYVSAAVTAWLVGRRWLPRTETMPGRTPGGAIPGRVAGPLILLAVAGTAHDQLPMVMLGALADARSVGLYDVARRTASLPSFALVVLSISLAPRIAELHTTGRKTDLARLVARAAPPALIVSLAVGAVLIACGESILSFFGEGFDAVYPSLVILTFGQLVYVLGGFAVPLLNMTGHDADVAWSFLGAGALNAGLSMVLVPPFAVEGAAVATAVSLGATTLFLTARVSRRLHIGVWPVRARQRVS